MKRYNPKELEPKWQKVWEEQKIYQASDDTDKPKRYVLEFFPYPSGAAMHVGHVRNYTIGDAIARFYRMQGFNVLHPMGWDAFGLPAENYAIKNNISPAQAIEENTTKFKEQLIKMGFSYDWSREINSSDPSYYKWTQWFFTLLFEKALAYQKESLQWWCETDKTVLANEQVEAGKCWRCGNEVTKKSLKQWFFKITDYADRLVEDLDKLDWSDAIKSMQRNWIGRSIGAEIDFEVVESEAKNSIKVFTTRPDTLFGATFMVVAPEHPLIKKITTPEQQKEVEVYIKQAQAKSDIERQETDREKTGVFTGSYVTNPVNNVKIPVWIADYVLYGYGTGAIMAVPAHDQRDNEFAKKFEIPIKTVVLRQHVDELRPMRDDVPTQRRDVAQAIVKHPTEDKYLLLKLKGWETETFSLPVGGVEKGETPKEAARRELLEETGYKDIGDVTDFTDPYIALFYHEYKKINVRGTFHTFFTRLKSLEQTQVSAEEQEKHDLLWVSLDELHDKLAGQGVQKSIEAFKQGISINSGEGLMVNSGKYDGMSSSEAREKIVADLAKSKQGQEKVNYKIRDWLISRQRYWGAPIPIIHCPKDGAVAVPKDQLPVELPQVKSYQPTGEGTSVLASVDDWVNTTCPKCGGNAKRETDTMDGFACSSWYFLRFADPHNAKKAFDEDKAKFWLPVDDYIGGAEHAVMHLLYARMWTKVMFDADLINFDEPFLALRNQGMILAPDGRKMSKSWGNVIAPDEIINQGYGADSIRIMELFIGPWNQSAAWSVEGMGGCFRFVQRVWTLCQEYLGTANNQSTESNDQLLISTHKTIKKVTEDMHDMGYNTAISALMELTNQLYKIKAEKGYDSKSWAFALNSLLQLLAPFAPHITEELWQQLGNDGSIHIAAWPKWDEKYLQSDTTTIVVQVNGKVRANISVASGADKQEIIDSATKDERIAEYLNGKQIRKTIYVPGKLVNFVV